jgi:hypothetical protein
MEKKLADLERCFGDPMWKIVCNDFPDFSWEPLRKMVALMAAVTWLRTPRQFEFWKSMHRQFIEFFSRHERLPDSVVLNGTRLKLNHTSWPAYRDATEEDMKKAWNEWLGQAAGIAEIFIKMRWAVVVSDAPVFITSDNPVLVGDPLGPPSGLGTPGDDGDFPAKP